MWERGVSVAARGIAAGVLAILCGEISRADGPAPLPSGRPETAPQTAPQAAPPAAPSAAIDRWCREVRAAVRSLAWNIEPCKQTDWRIGGWSHGGRPLLYAEFGDPSSDNKTLVLTMVHGDEVTPLYLGFRLIGWAKENREHLRDAHIIISPLVNPDGFLSHKRTRTNSRGVDTNRNFATRDWAEKALRAWKGKFKSDPRRFPGAEPRSEAETIFQEQLITGLRPRKILSIHAPLNVTDYDGPNNLALSRFPLEYVQECLRLRSSLKAKSTGFFPGSLGNFAGSELGIPTITLELPTADPKRAKSYWELFRPGIQTMIRFKVPDLAQAARR